MGIMRRLVITVNSMLSLLLLAPHQSSGGKLDLGLGIVEVIDIGIRLLGRPAETPPSPLSEDSPGVHIAEVIVQPEHLNVGEKARVSIEFFVSYGCSKSGYGQIKLFRNGERIDIGRFKQASPGNFFERRVVDLSVMATHPGESRLHLEIDVVGSQGSWLMSCFQVSRSFSFIDRSLMVGEPYEIEISDPFPREVKPGQKARATLSVKVRTASKGRLISGRFAGKDVKQTDLPGRSYPGEEKWIPVAEESLWSEGCEFNQDLTPELLQFAADRIHIRVFLKDLKEGRYYDFKRDASGLPHPVMAVSRPIWPYHCQNPARFDRRSCRRSADRY